MKALWFAIASLWVQISAQFRVIEPHGYSYLGCYLDSEHTDRNVVPVLRYRQPSSTNATIESCVASCSSHESHRYAGLRNGIECYCDNVAASEFILVDDNACGAACNAGSEESCGGSSATSVYSLRGRSFQYPVVDNDPGYNYLYQGCFFDSNSSRVLTGSSKVLKTTKSCARHCDSIDATFFGVRSGTECFCGNYTEHATRAPDGCNVPCFDDHTHYCGGQLAIQIYSTNASVAQRLYLSVTRANLTPESSTVGSSTRIESSASRASFLSAQSASRALVASLRSASSVSTASRRSALSASAVSLRSAVSASKYSRSASFASVKSARSREHSVASASRSRSNASRQSSLSKANAYHRSSLSSYRSYKSALVSAARAASKYSKVAATARKSRSRSAALKSKASVNSVRRASLDGVNSRASASRASVRSAMLVTRTTKVARKTTTAPRIQ